ncbi:MAG: LacI family DNA-binding transcriptional regulator [Chloroflexota bacterium]
MTDTSEFTIADVAKAAGVSISTVSRILNGKQDVADATRQRVQRVIEELGYSPHAQAQRLRAGKTRNIALLFPLKYPDNTPFNPLDMDFIVGAAAAAGQQDFYFSLLTTPVTQSSLLNLYRSSQVDGLVLMQIHAQDWRVDLLREQGYPFVMIGHCDDNTGLSFIDMDFEASVTAAFDHLVNLGHRNIGFLGQALDLHAAGYGPAARSWNGYQQALQTYNLPSIYREVPFSGKDVVDATYSMLDESPSLSAIFTTHAYTALNIIQALDERNLRIPEDCSMVTVTTGRIAELSSPTLTNIDFPSYEMGYHAVEMLTRTLEGTMTEPEQILIPPRLVIRNSTSSAKSK